MTCMKKFFCLKFHKSNKKIFKPVTSLTDIGYRGDKTMPVISAVNNSIRAIERLTNNLGQGERRPGRRPGNTSYAQQATKGQAISRVKLPTPKDVVRQIIAKEGVKANARVIQTADDMIGTIINMKV